MRIALVTHRFVKGDGQGRVNYEIARAALDAGHEIWLVAAEIAPELAARPLAHSVCLGLPLWKPALIREQLFAIRSGFWLRRNRRRFDLVHANGFITWANADINTSHFVHSAWLRSPAHTAKLRRDWYGVYQWIYSRVNSVLERWAYQRSSVVVAVSNRVRDELISAGIAPERIRVLANGVDPTEFTPTPVARESLGLPTLGMLLLFVGDIRTPRKNLETVLRAMTRLPGVTLAVAGLLANSPYPKIAEALGVAERVRFLDYRRDVPLLMRAADVLVFPSRYEAYGLVILEALASGLPVVAARTVGGAELVTPQCGVLLDDANDAAALADAVSSLATDSEARSRMRVAARKVAEAHSWSLTARRYLDVYDECSGDGTSAAPTAVSPDSVRSHLGTCGRPSA